MEAIEYAKQWKDSTPEVELALKAQVNPGDTTTTAWAGALVPPFQYMASEFMELLRPATILGKVPNFKRVPFRALVPKQTGGGSYGWVGEKAPKPATKLAFGTVSLGMDKIAGIITLTSELVKLSQPAAEDVVRADMIAGIAQFMDNQFITPGVAATSVSPASITNGLAGIPATADPLADITALVEAFSAANLSLSQCTFIMSEVNAFALSTRYYSTGAPEFPNLNLNGGTIFGIPVVVSQTAQQLVILVYGPGDPVRRRWRRDDRRQHGSVGPDVGHAGRSDVRDDRLRQLVAEQPGGAARRALLQLGPGTRRRRRVPDRRALVARRAAGADRTERRRQRPIGAGAGAPT